MGMFDDLIPQKLAEPPKGARLDAIEPPNFVEEQLAKISLPSWMDNLRGRAPYRVMQGMADPAVGAAQLVANMLPDATGIPDAVNSRIKEQEAQYQAARKIVGSEGFDPARLAGNVAAPTNLVIAAKVPMAAGAGMRAIQGGGIGALTAAMEPVRDTKDGFFGQKAMQVAAGAATGAVLAPVMGKVADVVIRKFSGLRPLTAEDGAAIEASIKRSLADLGQSIDEIPPQQLQALREQVAEALAKGRNLDPSALLRKGDFEKLGMEPTLGQITRDPKQFAREQNLRGVENVGEPLLARFQQQGNQLQDRLSIPAAGARDAYNAGTAISESLGKTDDLLRRHVSGLYGEARQSVGKDLEIPLQGLAQDYAKIVTDFGDKVPAAIRAKFSALGLDPRAPSNQRMIFTMESADRLMKNINQLDPGFSDKVTSTALGELRNAIRNAVTSVDASGGPYAPAVKAAAERFKLHDAVPALKAAAEGSVAPDDFVARFIVNGKTNDVKGLAGILKQSDPAAYQEARAQIADVLKRAAFGEAQAGSDSFAPARYMSAMRKLGTEKLSAFFTVQEVDDLMRVGRVASYINRAPNSSAVNRSNTASAMGNLFGRIPGAPAVVGLVNRTAGAVNDNATVRNALAAKISTSPAALSPADQNFLAHLMALAASGGGSAAASQ